MMIVADNLHVINPIVARALEEMDPRPVEHLVRRCQAAGAQAIDINSGPLGRDSEKKFAFLVETVQSAPSPWIVKSKPSKPTCP